MTDRRFTGLVAVATTSLILVVALTLSSRGEADTKDGVSIEYAGQLLDEKRKPIAGIFALDFILYKGPDDKKEVWRESHWVSVAGGKYKVRLGTQTAIRQELASSGQALTLGVNLKGVGELTRESIELPKRDADPIPVKKTAQAPPVKATPEVEAAPAKKQPKKTTLRTESSFSEVAEFAKRSGVAENAEKLGGMSRKDLEGEISRLRTLLAEHRNTNHGGGELEIGTKTTVLPRIGGVGGSAYLRECPPGHVVTGVRGSAGALVDSFQIICSPIK